MAPAPDGAGRGLPIFGGSAPAPPPAMSDQASDQANAQARNGVERGIGISFFASGGGEERLAAEAAARQARIDQIALWLCRGMGGAATGRAMPGRASSLIHERAPPLKWETRTFSRKSTCPHAGLDIPLRR